MVEPSERGTLALAISSTADFVVSEGSLRFYAARSSTIAIHTISSRRAICQIHFGKDGSIYFILHYFSKHQGIVSRIELDPAASGRQILDLKKGGRATAQRVKFSHHPSGEALFSLSKRVRSEIRRQSWPLAGSIGHLLQICAFGLEDFRHVGKAICGPSKLYLYFDFGAQEPDSVVIDIQWRRKTDVLKNVSPADGALTVGPAPRAIERSTGRSTRFYLVGQPKDLPLTDHLLLIECYETDRPTGLSDSALIVMGGWDAHEINPPGRQRRDFPHSGLLSCMYPVKDFEALKDEIGTIDLAPS